MKVFVIPLAEKGFIPISENNPTHWYLENENGKLNTNLKFNSKKDAETFALKMGWKIDNP